jgi:cyclic beta-1,2-glucan synthetase
MNQELLVADRKETELAESRAAGTAAAGSLTFEGRRVARAPKPGKTSYLRRILSNRVGRESLKPLIDSLRLVRTAEKEVREYTARLRRFPLAKDAAGQECVRVAAVARAYLDRVRNRFSEDTCLAFLDGFQDGAGSVLEIDEIWGLRLALQRELLERLAVSPALWPVLLASLRQVADLGWKELFEAANRVDRALALDPVTAYSRMEFESRERYRHAIVRLASRSVSSELEIAEAALSLARQADAVSDGSRAAIRRAHVGYYLVDKGLEDLREAIHYRPSWADRFKEAILRRPTVYYLVSIELITFVVVAAMLTGVGSLTPIFAGLLLLLLPATQAAASFVNALVTFLVPPRALPRLDFSKGIPDDCTTMVAVPSLLLNEAQVRDLVLDLEIRFLANRGAQLYFALLTDCPDADRPIDERDRLVEVAAALIKGLNRRYPESPFFLLHRDRVYNEKEGRWMGWERKRGKLLDFNRLLRGGYDSFPVKVGNVAVLPRIRYVITLDSDTQLPRDSAARLVGTIVHPLNAAVIDHTRRLVVEGYGILQPRIGISIHSAARSRLAALYSGETGFDLYTRAVSDVYQDLFGEGIFAGKGIYEVDVLREVLEFRFPENALLSHDLLEGAYARAGLVSDIELIDDYPSHFSAYTRRKHRWLRGDWQTMRWLLDRVPDRALHLAPNPISVIARWKILDNARRSLLEPSLVLLFLGAWFFLPGRAGYWTAAGAAMPFLAANWTLLFTLLRPPRRGEPLSPWLYGMVRTFVDANLTALFSLVFLLHQALISADAIFRSVLRTFVTGRKMLEWETAAEAETPDMSRATVDVYLAWAPFLAMALGALVWRFRPRQLAAAAPLLALWMCSRALSAWLNRPPRTAHCALARQDIQWLREYGDKMCRFFRDWSSPATNWLIPDYVREDGETAPKLSPTNLGMLLNARIAAMHFGTLTLADFALETNETLERVLALAKYRGHLLNWYDGGTLEPTGGQFISTVDSGNLAVALWTLRQAALAFAAEPVVKRGLTPAIAAQLARIAAICERLVREMDFRFLYEPRRKALSVGYDLSAGRMVPSYYDLLASEARIATFIAIAKGDIPQEAWIHLGRAHTLSEGECVLLSWTGTMFEYLMPTIWMKHYPGTITYNTIRAVVKTQREYARRKGIPWGISESAHLHASSGYGYGPFGIPDLALKRLDSDALVVSPYSSFLALAVDPIAALKNLKQMEEYGWTGRYGFYEAIDYTRAGGEPVRSWMAHHQGMSLLALCNLLYDQPLQRYFHAEPHVMATELLLHERLPATMQAEREAPVAIAAFEAASA